jgi:hypothetical protein
MVVVWLMFEWATLWKRPPKFKQRLGGGDHAKVPLGARPTSYIRPLRVWCTRENFPVDSASLLRIFKSRYVDI